MNKKHQPIQDPIAHASQKTGREWTVLKAHGDWENFASFQTTGAFAELDGGYKRHCGPTAITNLLLAFETKKPSVRGKHIVPARAFSRIAQLGRRRHYYLNADALRIYGGTFNIATKAYIRRAFLLYQKELPKITGPVPALRPFLTRTLDQGKLLYMELVMHPLYGNHHVIVYGYRLLQTAGGKRRLYLLAADGWNTGAHFLYEGDLFLSRFLAIEAA